MSLQIVVVSILLLAVRASALPCSDLKMTEEQKESYNAIREVFFEETKGWQKELKETKRRYQSLLQNSQGSRESASQLAHKFHELTLKLRGARSELYHSLIYDIASIEQRDSLLQCLFKKSRKEI